MRKPKERKLSEMQTLMGIHLKELGLTPEYEMQFVPARKWRFDVYLYEAGIAIEIHGGQFSGGHRRGWWNKKEAARRAAEGLTDTPQEDEYLKLSTATMMGWRVLQFSNEQVGDGRAKAFIADYLKGESLETNRNRRTVVGRITSRAGQTEGPAEGSRSESRSKS